MTIGERAYLAICEKAEQEGISVKQECWNLEIDYRAIYGWKMKRGSPRADTLQRMCLMGYDVIYILTGESVC